MRIAPGAQEVPMTARPMGWRFVLAAVIALVVVVGAAGPARSAFPGSDGRIAFTRDSGGGPAELWTIDPATNATTQLTSFGVGANPVESPAWSPDGDEIAFSQGGYVFAYDIDDQQVRSITDINSARFDGEPAWSPDGTMLALTSSDGIWRVNSDGSGLVQLTDHRDDRDPAWSPDGGTIAFTREIGRAEGEDVSFLGNEIYLMNSDGSGQVRLTVERAASDPTWSPDGSRIAYVSRFNEQTDIVVRDADDPDAGLIEVTSGPDFESRPAWSPEGTRIVYEKRQPGSQDRALFIANANGSGGETPLTTGPADRSPDWERVAAPPGTDPTCSIGQHASRRGRWRPAAGLLRGRVRQPHLGHPFRRLRHRRRHGARSGRLRVGERKLRCAARQEPAAAPCERDGRIGTRAARDLHAHALLRTRGDRQAERDRDDPRRRRIWRRRGESIGAGGRQRLDGG